jgi:phospholipase/lecithinase/hemolysin
MPAQLRTIRTMAGCCAASLLAVAVQPAQARLSSLSNLYVFGDSLTDIGNSWVVSGNALPPSPYYDNGRTSNGPVSPDYLWGLFNPASPGLLPSKLGGTVYAVNGSTTGFVNFNSIRSQNPPPIQAIFTNQGAASQLSAFTTTNPSFDSSTSLFMIWLFPNDVLGWLSTAKDAGTVLGGSPAPADAQGLIQNGISNIATMITALAGRGATKFLVPNMADLGSAPVFRGKPFSPLLSSLTAAFNTNLDPVLQSLDSSLPGVEITRFQTDDLFSKLVHNPGSYGFTNVTDACLNISAGTICSNPDQWLFWDDIHLTTAGQRVVAQNFYGAIAAPGPLPLAGATVAFGWSRRLRRRIKLGRCSAAVNPTAAVSAATSPARSCA